MPIRVNFKGVEFGPKCPKCGGETVKRTSYRGTFWGCLSYPYCNGLVPIASVYEPKRQWRGRDTVRVFTGAITNWVAVATEFLSQFECVDDYIIWLSRHVGSKD